MKENETAVLYQLKHLKEIKEEKNSGSNGIRAQRDFISQWKRICIGIASTMSLLFI